MTEFPIPRAALLDGNALAATIRNELRDDVADFTRRYGRPPGLRVVLVGEHPASASYVSGKTQDARAVGLDAATVALPETTSEAELLALLDTLNRDDAVDGVLVQLPLPSHIRTERIVEAIAPEKDVDGFHPENVGRAFTDTGGLLPCTPAGILELLERADVATRGLHAVVVGRSLIVGKPMASLLSSPRYNCTVTLTHRHTRDLAAFTRAADLLVVAVGQPGLITADMVKDGAVVIDVGINRVDDPSRERGYKLVGDVAFDDVAAKARLITPVPGGVGPMTRAMLLRNTVQAARARAAEP